MNLHQLLFYKTLNFKTKAIRLKMNFRDPGEYSYNIVIMLLLQTQPITDFPVKNVKQQKLQ